MCLLSNAPFPPVCRHPSLPHADRGVSGRSLPHVMQWTSSCVLPHVSHVKSSRGKCFPLPKRQYVVVMLQLSILQSFMKGRSHKQVIRWQHHHERQESRGRLGVQVGATPPPRWVAARPLMLARPCLCSHEAWPAMIQTRRPQASQGLGRRHKSQGVTNSTCPDGRVLFC